MEAGSVKTRLDVLCLEDNRHDRQLMEATLASEGLDCRFVHVKTWKEFEQALQQKRFGVILSDYSLPGYGGMAALGAARKWQPETPFVLISGTIGEERAVENLRAGATDCVFKSNLGRLAPVIRRALREAEDRIMRKRAEAALRTQSEQLRALTARVLAGREAERLKVAREIHDELGQALTGLKFGLSRIRQLLERRERTISWNEVFGKMDELGSLADATADRVRKICSELRPTVLDEFGLISAMQWQAREFQARTGIGCSLRFPSGVISLGEQEATALFRIFQEILTNVARHAGATRVVISLEQSLRGLRLRVADNGRGIAPAALASPDSLGVLGMRERVALLGGELHILGLPGQGTTVKVLIPVTTPAGLPNGFHHSARLTP